eukprot:11184813-Lingulodinium_polyedra.AAC.1
MPRSIGGEVVGQCIVAGRRYRTQGNSGADGFARSLKVQVRKDHVGGGRTASARIRREFAERS